MVPHGKNGYDHVMSKMGLVMARGKKEVVAHTESNMENNKEEK